MELCSATCASICSTCSGEYPSVLSASGTVRLAMVIVPPPTSVLYFTREKSGSTPVVSQSMRNEMVPVGARTVACALR